MRCALVLPSILLLGSQQGARIDSHDAVIRFNQHLPNNTWAADVGHRTTHLISNAFDFHEEACERGAVRCIVAFSEAGLNQTWRGLDAAVYSRVVDMVSRERMAYMSEGAFDKAMSHYSVCVLRGAEREGVVPSTGFKAIFHAAHACKRTTVFGFASRVDAHTAREYDTGYGPCKCHDLNAEHRCMKRGGGLRTLHYARRNELTMRTGSFIS